MAVTAISNGVNGQLYRNAVRPVGEAICLNFVKESITLVQNATQSWFYDFEVDANYVVTGLEVTKTSRDLSIGADTTTGQRLSVIVWRVGAGTDAEATATNVAQATLSNALGVAAELNGTGNEGTRVFAGQKTLSAVAAANAAAVAIGGNAAADTDPSLVSNQYLAGSSTDPMVKILANGTVVNNKSKQRIRIAIATVTTANANLTGNSASCFIKVDLARFSDIIQSEELTSPTSPTSSTSEALV